MTTLLGILNIGGPEMIVILVIGLLVFGRRLPEVGAQVGRAITQMRRGLQDFKDQVDANEDIRDVKDSVREVREEFRRAATVPRITASPSQMLQDLTDEALSSPGPDLPDESDPENGAPEGDTTVPETESKARED